MVVNTRLSGRIILFLFLTTLIASNDISVARPSSFTLRDDIVRIQRLETQWKIEFVCEANVGQCKIQYIFVPPGWKTEGQKVIVPFADTENIRRYALQLNVSEPTGDSSLQSIVLDFEDGEVFMRIDTVSSRTILDGRNSVDSSIPSQNSVGTGNGSFNQQIQENLIQKTSSAVNEFGQNFLEANNIVDSLPSFDKVRAVSSEGDVADIALTIQNAVEFDQKCPQKLPYLENVTAIVEDELKKGSNQISFEKMKRINESQQLSGLLIEKQSIQRQLEITGDKEQNQRQIKSLEFESSRKFSDFYQYARIADTYKQRLDGMINAAGVDLDQLKELRANVTKDQQAVSSIEEEIKKLVIEKTHLERRIKANERKIRDVEAINGQFSEEKLASLESKFKQYSQLSAHSERAYLNAEAELEKARNSYDLSKDEIDELTQRLREIQKKLNNVQLTDDLKIVKMESRLQSLERNLQKLKQAIKTCRDELPNRQTNQEPIKTSQNSIILKIVPPIDIYEFRSANRINQQINIFSSGWIMAYGVPRPFRFGCSTVQNLASGYGQIVLIKSSMIRVLNVKDGTNYDLHIGVCSRISAKNSMYVPRVGDIIDWEGIAESFSVYNVHRAQVYEN